MPGGQLRFGDCLFDPEAREVRRGGRALDLSPKALGLLGALLDRRPAVVRKEALRDLLWPKTSVGHTSLPRIVTELRRALGDDTRDTRYIRTVHGFGYAFGGSAVEVAAKGTWSATLASLRLGLREFLLLEGENLIGRSGDCLVRIGSSRVSRHHARVVVVAGIATLEDLGSKNGTFVEAKRLEQPVVLRDGDHICVGPAVLVYVSAAEAGSTETGSGSRPPS
jgi:DNA-binding winged helix-turn-helix (wHTH) protein